MGDNHYNVVGSARHVVQMGTTSAGIDMTGDDIRVNGQPVSDSPQLDVAAVLAELRHRALRAPSTEHADGLREAMQVLRDAASLTE